MSNQEPQHIKEWRHFLKGIVIGVLGNILVSAVFGTIESSGLNKIFYTIIAALSVLILDFIVKTEGEELGIPKDNINKVRLGFWGYFIFIIIWFLLTFFVFKFY